MATLARVGLGPEDIQMFREQLSRVLEHFEVLAKLDTEGIPPTAQVITLQNVMRRDEPDPSRPQPEILANAPRSEEGLFRVRAVLED